jgi:hypothetical protein
MAPQPSLDMGDRDSGELRPKRASKGARRVALDDGQLGSQARQRGSYSAADHPDMRVGVVLPRAIEPNDAVMAEPVIRRIESGVLAGEYQERLDGSLRECCRNRFKLDGFGTSPDDERNATVQLSPYLGAGKVPPLAPGRNPQRKLSE